MRCTNCSSSVSKILGLLIYKREETRNIYTFCTSCQRIKIETLRERKKDPYWRELLVYEPREE